MVSGPIDPRRIRVAEEFSRALRDMATAEPLGEIEGGGMVGIPSSGESLTPQLIADAMGRVAARRSPPGRRPRRAEVEDWLAGRSLPLPHELLLFMIACHESGGAIGRYEVDDWVDAVERVAGRPVDAESGRRPVFLCHSSGDKERVRALRARLLGDGITCWLDEEDLLPGQDWDREIRRALRASGHVLACLSNASTTRAGYVQKELVFALDRADERPEGTIFLIPVRLEPCRIPDRLSHLHVVDLFVVGGYERLVRALGHTSRSGPARG